MIERSNDNFAIGNTRQKAQDDYDQMLEAEVDKFNDSDYSRARERLHARGFDDPSFEVQEALSAQEIQKRILRTESHHLQEERLGLTGDTSMRTPEDVIALRALMRESDELFIRNIIKSGGTLDEAEARLRAKKERAV